MHQDKKVGLALALLVVGFVGAFCLRQDRNTSLEIPELNDPHYLDEQIADKDRTPYLGSTDKKDSLNTQLGSEQTLTGITDTGQPAQDSKVAVPTISHTRPGAQSQTSNAERWGKMPDFLKEIELPEEQATIENQFTSSDLSDSTFEPNQTEGFNQPETPARPQGTSQIDTETRKPAHNNAWEVNPSQQRSEPPVTQQRRPQQFRLHTVKSGETLSEISIRYLGTSRKYREIFNLNRDQLRSPNDIREGMKLRIPAHQSPEMNPQSANRQSNTGTPAVSGKRTIGQMVSQPTMKSDSSSVKFEGLIESLSQSTNVVESIQNQDKAVQQREKSLSSQTPLKDQNVIQSIPENYRKFIPVPRSPLTPGSGSQSGSRGRKSGHALSQVQPENVDEIVEDLFDKLPESAQGNQSANQAETYVIRKGDTLESIAVRLYGKRSAAFKIYQENRDLLKNADYIRPGMKLRLP